MARDRHHLHSTFRPEENLPEEFSWENMEQGIYEKMQVKKKPGFTSHYKNTLLVTTGVVVLTALAIALFTRVNNNGSNSIAQKETILNAKPSANIPASNPETTVNGKKSASTASIVKTLEEKNQTTITSTLHHEVNHSKITYSHTINKKIQIQETPGADSGSTRLSTDSESSIGSFSPAPTHSGDVQKSVSPGNNPNNADTDNIENNNTAFTNINTDNQHGGSDKSGLNDTRLELSSLSVSNDNVLSQSSTENSTLGTTNISALPLISYTISSTLKVEKIRVKTFALPAPLQKDSNPKNIIRFHFGLHRGFTKFGGDSLSVLKSKYEKDLLGYQTGLGYERLLSKNWSIYTGFSLVGVRSLLDYEQSTRFSELRDDILLSMEINTITNDTIKTYGQGIATGVKQRKVVHYNSQHIIQIPVIFNYRKDFGPWTYSAGAGPVLQYTVAHEGRTIQAIDSFQNLTTAYTKQLNVGAQLSTSLYYTFKNNLSLGLQLHWTQALQPWNAATDFTKKTSLLAGNLTLGYQW